jgi:UDP-N-acetylmuramoyl-tripeptide--D-alanyl-D-alanine ligase
VPSYPSKTKIVGDYNLENIRAAWTLGKHFEVTVEDIISALENYEPKNNRSQKVLTDKNEIILDAYNANPDSMKLALENFAKIRSDKKKIVILGDMFELGSFAPEEHQKVLDLVAEFGFEAYFASGCNRFILISIRLVYPKTNKEKSPHLRTFIISE